MWSILASTVFLSLMGALIRVAGAEAHVFQIVAVRSLVGVVLCGLFAGGDVASLLGRNRRLLALRGFIGIFAMLFSFYAFTALPVAEATVLFYVSPAFVALFARLFLGERLSAGRLLCALVSFAGVLLVARPALIFGAQSHPLPWLAVAAALGGAMFSAGAMVTVRALGSGERALSPIFHLNLFALCATAPLAAFHWTAGDAGLWACLIAIGLVTHLGQYFMTRGLAMESAACSSMVGYVQVVFAVFWGALLFAEYPDGLSLAGAAVIMAGTLGLRRRPKSPPAPGT